MKLPLQDPKRLRLPPEGFQCGETVEEGDVGSVLFHCLLPSTDDESDKGVQPTKKIVFSCRDKSVGVLLTDEEEADEEELENENVDPFFFDEGYTLAGATGFMVWAGTRILLESLTWPAEKGMDNPKLVHYQRLLSRKSTKVLELGAGVGVIGTCLAANGSQVLLTDLPTLVDNAIFPNLKRNRNEIHNDGVDPPDWLLPNGVPIGKGWASARALDWTQPVNEQLSLHRDDCDDFGGLDLIVSSDCVWLVSMLDALLNTVEQLFAQNPMATLLLSFQRRDTVEGDDSPMFTTVDRVVSQVEARQWEIECLAWRPIVLTKENNVTKEVFVFEITQPTGRQR